VKWLVVDGIDGSGKNTVGNILKEWYVAKGDDVVIMQHPSNRLSGKISRKALQSEGALMRVFASVFYITDVLISVSKLKRLKRTNKTVIFIRYLMGTAYLPERFVELGYDLFAKVLPTSKAMMLVDIKPEVAHDRIFSRTDTKEMFEDIENLRKARRKVIGLSKKGWTVLENSGDIEESKASLFKIVESWEKEGATSYPR